MRISTMKKMRNTVKFISMVFFIIGIGIAFYWVFRYGFREDHSVSIFLKAFITSMVFNILSLIMCSVSDYIQDLINNRYRQARIREQNIQLKIEDIRMRTVLK